MADFTEKELAKKSAKELEDILCEMGLRKTGNKSAMSARIIKNQSSYNARKAAANRNPAPDDEEDEDEDDDLTTLKDIGRDLRLSGQTIASLNENDFSTLGDLKMLEASDFKN